MPASSLLYPLTDYYNGAAPEVTPVEPRDIPEPYRSLLVHDRDMTPTLEASYGGKLHLRVLRYDIRGNVVRRLVALVMDDESPVEMGAIHIFLDRLPAAAAALVLERRRPFGAILASQGVDHTSSPAGYFRVHADKLIGELLGEPDGAPLFGRRNTLRDPAGEPLAEVVEILPRSGDNS